MLECLVKGHLHAFLLAGGLSSGSQHDSEAGAMCLQHVCYYLRELTPCKIAIV